jgi:DNA-binding HxlR family transcriptional regulator
MLHARRPNPVSDCPITAAMAAVGGKWKGLIVFHLAASPKHFGALREAMPDISKKVLTEQLGELIADDIVDRTRTGPAPAPIVYSLTGYGRSVVPLVESLRVWGRAHIQRFVGSAYR